MSDAVPTNSNHIWRRMRRWVIGFVVCTLIALFLASQRLLPTGPDSIEKINLEDVKHIVGHYLVVCYIWGLLTNGIVATTSRIGLDRNRWVRSGLTYLLVGIAFSIVHVIASLTAMRLFAKLSGGNVNFLKIPLMHLLAMLQSNLILFTIITSFCLALSYYRKFQDRELRATKLESELTQAQLDVLKTQLQPHFLFNTLNAITALVRDNPESAERMIVRLSDLLRTTLDNVEHEEVTVRDELEFVRRYMEIEKMRFGERLIVEERIDPETALALVPTLILQTLVENAMRHGVAAVSTTCRVTIAVQRSNSHLCLEVLDTGPGLRNARIENGRGVGIANTKDRLRHLYGDNFRFEAGNRSGGGFAVKIKIPFHEETLEFLQEGGQA